MLSKITFKAGSSPGQPPLSLDYKPSVTIFVGPNYSGKSVALAEIAGFVTDGKVVARIERPAWSREAAVTYLSSRKRPTPPGQVTHADHTYLDDPDGQSVLVHNPSFLAEMQQGVVNNMWRRHYAVPRSLFLTGENRTGMLSAHPRGDLRDPKNPFERLLMNDPQRTAFRAIIQDATRLYFGFDAFFKGAEMNAFFGQSAPPDEKSLSNAMRQWLDTATPANDVSDGVRAFVGMLLQIYASDPELILIDEPEAFLHPSIAHRFGKELAQGALAQRKTVFASTHNAHFLMGAIQSGAEINIVRLTYRSGVATARHLESATLRTFMNDPLLRSVGVLDGLFFEHVVVCEADADRAFYSEINHRLLDANDPRGIPHALFLNADNKQTVPRIVKALRHVGIPAAAIIDIDLIVDDWNVVSKQLDACAYPAGQREGLALNAANVLKSLEAASPGDKVQAKRKHFKTEGRGVAVLKTKAEREAADNLFDAFDRYGCFAVRSGELENWLLHLKEVPRKKDGPESFRAKIFEAMGSDPNDAGYEKPAAADVWDFIGKVKNWLVDPHRRGIPD